MRFFVPFVLLVGPVLSYVISPSLRLHHSLTPSETLTWHLAARLATPEPAPIPQPTVISDAEADDDNANGPDPVAQLLQIMPSANTCTGSSFPSECATASTAVADVLIDSFSTYAVTTAAEQAALLSWIPFESGELKFNQNHFPAPGRPGQGTRTMMMPNFVSEYASLIPQLAAQVGGKSPEKVLKLVQPDAFIFGSAAWFYSTKCGDDVKAGVRDGGRAGWEAFVTGCVGTVVDEGVGEQSRVRYWERAMLALGMTI